MSHNIIIRLAPGVGATISGERTAVTRCADPIPVSDWLESSGLTADAIVSAVVPLIGGPCEHRLATMPGYSERSGKPCIIEVRRLPDTERGDWQPVK